jgi:hypothetical protein
VLPVPVHSAPTIFSSSAPAIYSSSMPDNPMHLLWSPGFAHPILFLPVDANFMMLLEEMPDFELCDANFQYPLLLVLPIL